VGVKWAWLEFGADLAEELNTGRRFDVWKAISSDEGICLFASVSDIRRLTSRNPISRRMRDGRLVGAKLGNVVMMTHDAAGGSATAFISCLSAARERGITIKTPTSVSGIASMVWASFPIAGSTKASNPASWLKPVQRHGPPRNVLSLWEFAPKPMMYARAGIYSREKGKASISSLLPDDAVIRYYDKSAAYLTAMESVDLPELGRGRAVGECGFFNGGGAGECETAYEPYMVFERPAFPTEPVFVITAKYDRRPFDGFASFCRDLRNRGCQAGKLLPNSLIGRLQMRPVSGKWVCMTLYDAIEKFGSATAVCQYDGKTWCHVESADWSMAVQPIWGWKIVEHQAKETSYVVSVRDFDPGDTGDNPTPHENPSPLVFADFGRVPRVIYVDTDGFMAVESKKRKPKVPDGWRLVSEFPEIEVAALKHYRSPTGEVAANPEKTGGIIKAATRARDANRAIASPVGPANKGAALSLIRNRPRFNWG